MITNYAEPEIQQLAGGLLRHGSIAPSGQKPRFVRELTQGIAHPTLGLNRSRDDLCDFSDYQILTGSCFMSIKKAGRKEEVTSNRP